MVSQADPLIFDHGSLTTKIGLGGYQEPQKYLPSSVSKFGKKQFAKAETELPDHWTLNLYKPIERGRIVDWDGMEELWEQSYSSMNAKSEEHPMVVTEVALNPDQTREQMAMILFEKFNIPSLFTCQQAVLSLYASGRVTGLALETGDGVTQAVPIVDGFSYAKATKVSELAGGSVTQYLNRVLVQEKKLASTLSDEDARNIKEKHCFIAIDADVEGQTNQGSKKEIVLPDGKLLDLGEQAFRCSDILFDPKPLDEKLAGMHTLVFQAITEADPSVDKNQLYNAVVLGGGNTLLKGLSGKLESELRKLAPAPANVKVVAQPDCQISSWIGASVLSSLSTFQTINVSRSEFNENGPSAITKKCNMVR